MKQKKLSEIGESYHLKFKIDLVNNKKEALLVNGLGIVVLLVMGLPIYRYFYSLGKGLANGQFLVFFISLIIMVLGSILYIGAHEAVHGLVMRCFTNEKLRFGWKFVYAYAGSEEGLFNPWEYMAVALAPLLTFAVLFVLLERVFPSVGGAFYFLQMMNVSGAMGDVYVFFKVLKHAKEELLINDTGTDMQIFERI